MTGPELIAIAKEYHAVCSETCNIQWDESQQIWCERDGVWPSVLDAAVLKRTCRLGPSYLHAVIAATGWSRDTIVGFQTVMLLGQPVESGDMCVGNMAYWRGIINGLLVYEKIKARDL